MPTRNRILASFATDEENKERTKDYRFGSTITDVKDQEGVYLGKDTANDFAAVEMVGGQCHIDLSKATGKDYDIRIQLDADCKGLTINGNLTLTNNGVLTSGAISGTASNADKLDNLDSSQFLRSDQADRLNVGRGQVSLESNSYDVGNGTGAGLTIRTLVNPVDGAIFSVRSSGNASRLWVGQDLTSSGQNPFYVGTDIDGRTNPHVCLPTSGDATIGGHKILTAGNSQFENKAISLDGANRTRNAVAGDRIYADTSQQTVTVNLPGSPSDGDTIIVYPVQNTYEARAVTVNSPNKVFSNGSNGSLGAVFNINQNGIVARFSFHAKTNKWLVFLDGFLANSPYVIA